MSKTNKNGGLGRGSSCRDTSLNASSLGLCFALSLYIYPAVEKISLEICLTGWASYFECYSVLIGHVIVIIVFFLKSQMWVKQENCTECRNVENDRRVLCATPVDCNCARPAGLFLCFSLWFFCVFFFVGVAENTRPIYRALGFGGQLSRRLVIIVG